jgi:uncharacterized repeat protein (TIGR01451 family)
MSTTLKKSLLIGLSIFLFIVAAIGVVYFVRKPATPTATPTPKPTIASKPVESATVAPIFVVDQAASACSKTFVVACASSSPSPSPSSSVSPSPSASPSTPPSAALKCMSKKMYEDDSRNRAGFYYLEKEIVDTTTMQSGQTIVYNIVTKNAGGNSAPDTTITDKLSTNLTYVDGDSGCTYDSANRTVTCVIGTLSPNSEAQRSFRAKIAVVGTTSIANTAEVSSTNGQRDSCSVKVDATGKVVTTATPAPTALPVAGVFEVTVGTVGVGLLLLIAGALGLLLI